MSFYYSRCAVATVGLAGLLVILYLTFVTKQLDDSLGRLIGFILAVITLMTLSSLRDELALKFNKP